MTTEPDPATQPGDLTAGLNAVAGRLRPGGAIKDLRRLTAGATQEVWRFELVEGLKETPLILRRAPHRPERGDYLALKPLPQDVEIELEPSYGLDGFIRARSVSITFEPGKPDAEDEINGGGA